MTYAPGAPAAVWAIPMARVDAGAKFTLAHAWSKAEHDVQQDPEPCEIWYPARTFPAGHAREGKRMPAALARDTTISERTGASIDAIRRHWTKLRKAGLADPQGRLVALFTPAEFFDHSPTDQDQGPEEQDCSPRTTVPMIRTSVPMTRTDVPASETTVPSNQIPPVPPDPPKPSEDARDQTQESENPAHGHDHDPNHRPDSGHPPGRDVSGTPAHDPGRELRGSPGTDAQAASEDQAWPEAGAVDTLARGRAGGDLSHGRRAPQDQARAGLGELGPQADEPVVDAAVPRAGAQAGPGACARLTKAFGDLSLPPPPEAKRTSGMVASGRLRAHNPKPTKRETDERRTDATPADLAAEPEAAAATTDTRGIGHVVKYPAAPRGAAPPTPANPQLEGTATAHAALAAKRGHEPRGQGEAAGASGSRGADRVRRGPSDAGTRLRPDPPGETREARHSREAAARKAKAQLAREARHEPAAPRMGGLGDAYLDAISSAPGGWHRELESRAQAGSERETWCESLARAIGDRGEKRLSPANVGKILAAHRALPDRERDAIPRRELWWTCHWDWLARVIDPGHVPAQGRGSSGGVAGSNADWHAEFARIDALKRAAGGVDDDDEVAPNTPRIWGYR